MKCKFAIAAGVLLPAVALAHTGEPLQPDDLWRAWEFDPGIVIPLAAAAWLYARGARVQRISTPRQHVFFWSGWISLVVALVSPLHPLGEVGPTSDARENRDVLLAVRPLIADRLRDDS